MSADPQVQLPASAAPLAPPDKAPFFSARNIPLWACLVLIAAVAGLIVMVPHP
jgi:hypothetical protein